MEGNDAFVNNNENDVTTFPPNEMEAATKQTPEVVVNLEGIDAFVINNENDVTTLTPNESSLLR